MRLKHKLLSIATLTITLSGCSQGLPDVEDTTDDGLPLGTLCDGSVETVYDERMIERLDCGEPVDLVIPTRRLEAAPRSTSPYIELRCDTPLAEQSTNALFECTETEFWHAFSDGRLSVRKPALSYMTDAIKIAEANSDGSAEYTKKLSRLYQLRGMFYMAMGIENGEILYLMFANLFAQADFSRVDELEPGNFVASSFNETLELANAQIAGDHAQALAVALDSVHNARTAGNPDVIEPVNVGTVLAVTGVTMNLPLNTGVPLASLDALLYIGCLETVEFCYQNTLHAPYARPGLEYHLASVYARLGMRDEYIAQLEVVASQDKYEEWAWYGIVEAQRADPDTLLDKMASFGDDQYSDSYANKNNGCVMCHGRI